MRKHPVVLAGAICFVVIIALAAALASGGAQFPVRVVSSIGAAIFGAGTGGIEGMVIGPDPEDPEQDLPVANAAVHAVLAGQVVASVATDAFGRYAIADLAPGTYDVRFLPPGYAAKVAQDVMVQADANTPVDVTDLVFEGKVGGTVTDSAETPLRNALVSIDCGGGIVLMAVSDEFGTYTIGNVPGGTYTVKASATRFEFDDRLDVAVTEGEVTPGIDFEATSGTAGTGEILGRVAVYDPNYQDPNDYPESVHGATVIALKDGAEVGRASTGSKGTASEGGYHIYQLPPSPNYVLCVIAPDYAAAFVENVAVEHDTQSLVDIALAAGESCVTVTVTDWEDVPVGGILLRIDLGSGVLLAARTDSQGGYTIHNVPTGTHTVEVSDGGLAYSFDDAEDVIVP